MLTTHPLPLLNWSSMLHWSSTGSPPQLYYLQHPPTLATSRDVLWTLHATLAVNSAPHHGHLAPRGFASNPGVPSRSTLIWPNPSPPLPLFLHRWLYHLPTPPPLAGSIVITAVWGIVPGSHSADSTRLSRACTGPSTHLVERALPITSTLLPPLIVSSQPYS
jgi:hypothetical protein